VGAALARSDRRVLIVDVDPQANATTGLGVNHRDLERSTYDLLVQEARLDQVVIPTTIDGLDCAPASVDLAGAELELVGAMGREHKLRMALVEATAAYDMILLDCPPSLGLLTLNAMVAADDLIVPVQCEYYALEGLGQLLGNAERLRRSLNPDLRVAGLVLTMYDARTNLSPEVAAEVRKHFGATVYRTVIPRSIRLSEAPSFGEPAITLDPASRGAQAYFALADEIASQRKVAGTASEPAGAGAESSAQEPVPGPAGRGFGVATPVPPGLDRSWPPLEPWTSAG
jgi:chromosome partitioning protein